MIAGVNEAAERETERTGILRGPIGQLPWPFVLGLLLATAVAMWAVREATDRWITQLGVALLALLILRLAQRRAAFRPLPIAVERASAASTVFWLVGFCGIGVVIASLVSVVAESALDFEPGIVFWIWLGVASPLILLYNRFGENLLPAFLNASERAVERSRYR